MNKENRIKKYGIEKHKIRMEQVRDWREQHPAQVQAQSREQGRKDGGGYKNKRLYEMNGFPHARALVRCKHRRKWTPFKQIIAPKSQIHHEWIPGTADFRGVALVETDQHLHGYVDVIKILDGKITLLTEKEIRGWVSAI